MDDAKRIEAEIKVWQSEVLDPTLRRFGAATSDARFYTPLDTPDFDFLRDVGFPGMFPFTADAYPCPVPGSSPQKGGAELSGGNKLARAGRYVGYGTPEDTRDTIRRMRDNYGWSAGPRLAFDLPTQCGYDPGHPLTRGEVGRTGVSVSTLHDLEIVFEAFQGNLDIDKTAAVFVVNPTANIILAMYVALAKKRGIAAAKLRVTVQNDILKEYIARGTQIFPPTPSMRMTRDTIEYGSKYLPHSNVVSVNGYHIREAGATREQCLGFTMANGIAYMNLGIEAGLDVDDFAPRISFGSFSGSMEIFKEIALRRAARRMWATIMKERFKARNPRSWVLRTIGGSMVGNYSMTAQRPINNVVRAALNGIASAMAGDNISCEPPYDEALGLGWSIESQQIADDAARILHHEARLRQVIDPFAGSYFMEALTNEIERDAWSIVEAIDRMGGAVPAIENGYMQKEVALSAYKYQREIDTGTRLVVGSNCFTGPEEVDVMTTRHIQHPYDPARLATAEERQISSLEAVKTNRDNRHVTACLQRLHDEAKDNKVNLIPAIIEAVEAYASLGEICSILRQVFGEYREAPL